MKGREREGGREEEGKKRERPGAQCNAGFVQQSSSARLSP